MLVQFKLKIGENEFTLSSEVENQIEFFKTVSFYSSLPKVGPSGETDLKLVYRQVQSYEFFSIVSEKAGLEYKFGQLKEPKGELFAKGWEPIYNAQGSDNSQDAELAQETMPEPQQLAKPAPAARKTTTTTTTTKVSNGAVANNAKAKNAASSILNKYGIS
jgi:hypothetical protein